MTQDDPYIAEFQRRRREFQPQWQRTLGLIFLPGFVFFVLGGQLPAARALVYPGIVVMLAGAVRGAWLIFTYRRCPACGAFQKPQIQYPYRTCRGCGVRLSMGAKDST
jgi:hypothetical protein